MTFHEELSQVACQYAEPYLAKDKMATTSVWQKPGLLSELMPLLVTLPHDA
ncbi:MAG: hypothetical protein WA269_07510 [Candidatus Udaeobacter sp.]